MSEQEAILRLAEAFPGSTVGVFEPNENGSRAVSARDIQQDVEGSDADVGVLVPLDFPRLLAEGVPETDYLEFPYVARGARHWLFGPAESAKTLYMQWLAAKLTREGRTVVFVSAENPLTTDLDRISRLRPDFDRLRYFHMPQLDLNEQADFLKLAEACGGADLVVLDTLSAIWSGDENSNREVVELDREVLVPLVRLTGAGLVLIHHTGHPQAFVSRGGANAGRGASAMGQKADVVMVFTAVGLHEFTIDHGKNRTPGGHKEPKARFRVVDTEDGGLEVEALGRQVDPRVAEGVEEAIELIRSSVDPLGSNALRAALREKGYGTETARGIVAELKQEDPARVQQIDGRVIGKDGRSKRGRPWVLVVSN